MAARSGLRKSVSLLNHLHKQDGARVWPFCLRLRLCKIIIVYPFWASSVLPNHNFSFMFLICGVTFLMPWLVRARGKGRNCEPSPYFSTLNRSKLNIKLVCRPECLEMHLLASIVSSRFGPLAKMRLIVSLWLPLCSEWTIRETGNRFPRFF
jgi:hypothetical protein